MTPYKAWHKRKPKKFPHLFDFPSSLPHWSFSHADNQIKIINEAAKFKPTEALKSKATKHKKGKNHEAPSTHLSPQPPPTQAREMVTGSRIKCDGCMEEDGIGHVYACHLCNLHEICARDISP
ncbi:hypothetical protein CKAN_00449000 [Cinnamomum micranthum f. kanehirae]|uniref:Uncharacterized protein n=1 Tax=Cinnamomum micranthum f. kanehirae TaxID=337451 RepID=A0A3S4NEE9_9MAGN|nr:hypothetical protein CKAN_00449000 [Cinnamomum micranthum f. kanehirae]